MTSQRHPTGPSWSRPEFIEILNASIKTRNYRFARQAALTWLSSYPGDLPVKLIQAKAMFFEGLDNQAYPILKYLIQTDPEYGDALDLLSQTSRNFGVEEDEVIQGCNIALMNSSKSLHKKTPGTQRWSQILAKTRGEIAQGDLDNAENHIQQVLGMASDIPLTGVTHMQVLRAKKSTPTLSIQSLAEHYHKRWPDCLQFMLILGETLMDGGESERAVALLHQAAARDVTGQVANRLWGKNHQYRNIWPRDLRGLVTIQIPADVSAYLGWNLLPYPESSPGPKRSQQVEKISNDHLEIHPEIKNQTKIGNLVKTPLGSPINSSNNLKTTAPKSESDSINDQGSIPLPPAEPETIRSFDDELTEISGRHHTEDHSRIDGRFPVYVIFTTQNGLYRKYGIETTQILEQEMRKLITAIRRRMDWGAILVYGDDPASMAQYGLKPAPAEDAWKLKLTLADLDDALGKRGAKIGAVLIMGGPDVVPFHYLPNPTDDTDNNVPSDNPYGTRDENYFITEWAVGRLPGGNSKDPGLLIYALRSMTKRHESFTSKPNNRFLIFWQWLIDRLLTRQITSHPSFGYSAEVWLKASSSVFRPIGDPRLLVTSPPIAINQHSNLPITKLGYFNLHGVADSAEWFGQRDPKNGTSGPDYPVAIHPKYVVNGGRAPKVIFSEACFGANIMKKSVEEALALKFLSCGSQAVIGSTVISYGSITTPLNAADLLGKVFWKYFKDDNSVGESLRLAKIYLANEMHNRQGYLDGEDQKTLISFVLYGDPLAQLRDINNWKLHKKMPEPFSGPYKIKTICDRVDAPGTSEPIPKDVIANVKYIVERYLPGMRDAKLSMSHEHAECRCVGHTCPTSQLGAKTKFSEIPTRRVVTLSKQIIRTRQVHETYARLTLDIKGKVVKLTVSR